MAGFRSHRQHDKDDVAQAAVTMKKVQRPLWKPLKGIVAPLPTPLLDHDTIDEVGTTRLIEHVIAGGVSGVFILGSTGEGPSLSNRLRRYFIRLCCIIVAKRVPVFVGVTDSSYQETIDLATVAEKAGANCLVLSAPYYFSISQTELFTYCGQVAEKVELPIMLYNIPALAKVPFEEKTLRKLCLLPTIVGMFDFSFDVSYFDAVCRIRDDLRPHDWTVMTGAEHQVVPSAQAGGDGCVVGGSNIFPALFVSLYHASVARDKKLILKQKDRVNDLKGIYYVAPGMFVQALKCALSALHICRDTVAEPLLPLPAGDRLKVQEIIRKVKKKAFDTKKKKATDHWVTLNQVFL